MAKATRKEVPRPRFTYTLELSQREAEVLAKILGRIGGDNDGPRGASAAVYHALREAGATGSALRNSLGGSPSPAIDATNCIYFADIWPPDLPEDE